MFNRLPCFALLFATAALRADVVLAPLFSDHAVLQRGKPVLIWGTADRGEDVTVTFLGASRTTTAGTDRRWRVLLPALPARAEPAELVVAGRNRITLRDIVVGDVWLASGQSNMEWPVKNSDNAATEMAAANLPLVRHIEIQKRSSATPVDMVRGDWRPASPETVGTFSGVGYYFARELHREVKVPIGIVHSSWGGSIIEAWLSEEALASDPAFAVVLERRARAIASMPERQEKFRGDLAKWKADLAAAKAKGEKFDKPEPRAPAGAGSNGMPAAIHNGMIHPLAPYALCGVIWYQGESNTARADEYQKLFAALITSWRREFEAASLPFYWVQLANYGSVRNTAWPLVREAQDRTLALPGTGQAVAIDLGRNDAIHPGNKQEVGRRLALVALARHYGRDVRFEGPRFVEARRDGSVMRVELRHAKGLHARGESPRVFELAGEDRKFVAATARIEGETLVVSAPEVSAPVAVRYAWHDGVHANIYNGDQLPLVPFRSDAW